MANQTITSRATITTTSKHRKFSDDHHSLLPGLPDHIAHLCLSLISPSSLYSVCRSWRRLVYSVTFPPFRSLYTLSLPTTTAGVDSGQTVKLFSFDPICSKWIAVESPLPPCLRHLSLRHPAFMSRNLPIQSISVAGNLVVIAATSVHRNSPVPAFPHPLIFNPLSNTWSSVPPLSTPRRWCAAGALRDTVIVASGIGSHYTEKVARSVEKMVFSRGEIKNNAIVKTQSDSFEILSDDGIKLFDKTERLSNSLSYINGSEIKDNAIIKTPSDNWEIMSDGDIKLFDKTKQLSNNLSYTDGTSPKINENDIVVCRWEMLPSLKHSKLCREAIDAVGWKGKLCMVNVKGDYAKEGFVYDLDSDEWAGMPEGMLGGWKGPTAAMDEETMYAVDESRGVLRRYNEDRDNWSEIIGDARLKGAEYIAAGGGRVCVVGEKDVGIVVVDVVAVPPRLWVLETPAGHDILSLHILPRMCLPEFQSPVIVSRSK